jgi:hypothetical protein
MIVGVGLVVYGITLNTSFTCSLGCYAGGDCPTVPCHPPFNPTPIIVIGGVVFIISLALLVLSSGRQRTTSKEAQN